MIQQPAYAVEPWSLRENRAGHGPARADASRCSRSSNGHIGLRGNLDEGEPHGLPGTYLNSFYELRPLPYAEAGYGYPESGQTVINVTNGKLIRLLVDDEPFDMRYGDAARARACAGPAGGDPAPPRATGRLPPVPGCGSPRAAGLVHPAGDRGDQLRASSRWRARSGWCSQSEMVANEQLPGTGRDPRAAAALDSPLVAEEYMADNDGSAARSWCTAPGQRAAGGGRDGLTRCRARRGCPCTARRTADVGRATVAAEAPPGEKLQRRQVHRLRLVLHPVPARGA